MRSESSKNSLFGCNSHTNRPNLPKIQSPAIKPVHGQVQWLRNTPESFYCRPLRKLQYSSCLFGYVQWHRNTHVLKLVWFSCHFQIRVDDVCCRGDSCVGHLFPLPPLSATFQLGLCSLHCVTILTIFVLFVATLVGARHQSNQLSHSVSPTLFIIMLA